jgi:hypothetical protein
MNSKYQFIPESVKRLLRKTFFYRNQSLKKKTQSNIMKLIVF